MLNLLLLTFLTLPGAADPTAFPLLRVPVGPRACAMGESFTGLADDVGAIFWNPAGLGQLTRVQLSLSHHEWFGGTRDEKLAGTLPLGPGFIGFGAVYSGVGGIELRDPENNPGGTAYSQSGYAIASYGFRPLDRLLAGASVKGIYDNLVGEHGYGAAGDVGVLYRPTPWLGIGATGRNLGPGIWYDAVRWPLPAELRIGLTLSPTLLLNRYANSLPRLRLLADAALDFGERPHFHLGGEYDLHSFLSLRAGGRFGPQDWRTLGWTSIITAGIGLRHEAFSLDYALVPYGGLGLTHRLSLSLDLRAEVYGNALIEVREFGTGRPVPARLMPEWVHQGMARTDADGTFRLEGIEPGWLKLTAEADDYLPASESVLIEPHRTNRVLLTVRKAGQGSLWGAVYDRASGRAVAARVLCRGPATDSLTTEDSEGSFTFRKLPAGEYALSLVPLTDELLGRDTTVTVEAGRLTSVTLCLDRQRTAAAHDKEPQTTVNRGFTNLDEYHDSIETESLPANE